MPDFLVVLLILACAIELNFFRTLYNQWVVCMNKHHQDKEQCKHDRWKVNTMCPSDWIEKWDGHREDDIFVGIQSPKE